MPPSLGDGESSYSQAEIHDCSRIKVVTVFLSSAKFQRVKLLTRLGCGQALRWSGLLIMMSYSGPFNLVSGSFKAATSLISNCMKLLFETQGRSWKLQSCIQEMKE